MFKISAFVIGLTVLVAATVQLTVHFLHPEDELPPVSLSKVSKDIPVRAPAAICDHEQTADELDRTTQEVKIQIEQSEARERVTYDSPMSETSSD